MMHDAWWKTDQVATEKYYEQIFEEMKELEEKIKGGSATCAEKAHFDQISE